MIRLERGMHHPGLLPLCLLAAVGIASADALRPPLRMAFELPPLPTINNSSRVYRHSHIDEARLLDLLHDPITYEQAPNAVYDYLWLQQFDQQEDELYGSKAAQRLVQLGFKRAWNQYRNRHLATYTYLPDGDGRGSVPGGMDYQLRLSDDRIKLQLEYRF